MMCYDWNRVLGLRVFFTSSHLQAPLSLRLVSSINEATLQTLLLAEVLQVLPVLQVLEVFQVHQVHQVHQVYQVLQVRRVLMV
jgi:hypothetical protein